MTAISYAKDPESLHAKAFRDAESAIAEQHDTALRVKRLRWWIMNVCQTLLDIEHSMPDRLRLVRLRALEDAARLLCASCRACAPVITRPDVSPIDGPDFIAYLHRVHVSAPHRGLRSLNAMPLWPCSAGSIHALIHKEGLRD